MWVARDKRDNRLTLFQYKPRKVKSLDGDYIPFWTTDKSCVEILDSTLFSELKWEDDPLEVNIIPTHIDMTEDLIPFIYNYGTEAHDELIRIFEKYLGNNRLK